MNNAHACIHFFLGSLLAAHISLAASRPAWAQTPESIEPPRTIADITAILDNEKPNSAILAKNKAAADAQLPRGASSAALYRFYLERGRARWELGRLASAREDGERAVKAGQGHVEFKELVNARQFIVIQHLNAGELKITRELLSTIERDVSNAPAVKGLLLTIYRWTISVLVARGDLAEAEGYLRRASALRAESKMWNSEGLYGSAREAEIERSKAMIAEARGRFRDAEIAYSRSAKLLKDVIRKLPSRLEFTTFGTKELLEGRLDAEISLRGRAKANQGRLAEAEADVRAGLLSRLKAQGKYTVTTAKLIESLAFVVSLQGRYAEAERLMRTTLEIRRIIGLAADSEAVVGNLSRLSSLATLQQRHHDAAKLDAEVDEIIKSWELRRREFYELDSNRVYSLLVTGRTSDGVAAAQRAVVREISRLGEVHPDVAIIRGLLAIGYAKAGRYSEALTEFRKSVPPLLAATRTTDIDKSAVVALRNARIRDVIEGYVGALASAPSEAGPDAASEAFRMIDAVRGRSVQQAVTASAARMVARDKALADLVRRDQDNEKQMAAHLGLVNSLLAQPSGERDDGAVRRLNSDIENLRAARATTRAEIARRFPHYAELIDPKSPTVADMRAVLRPGEALVSFYFGREKSFVWALPKDGRMAFATIVATERDIDAKIAQLRKALEPDVNTIPEFDVGLASELYDELLKPVEAGWKDAKSLIIVTNGALGLLPLGLLPRDRITLDHGAEPGFTAYRKVSWLARTHAITQVPSAAALRTLRQLPAGSPSREMLIGFGDPFFSEEQAAEAASETTTALKVAAADTSVLLNRRASVRTDQIDSADLARLPRLPDTADELKAIAQALRVDPASSLYLGKAAHESAVKAADLARYRIVAFATHGLLPGDLNGLTQPALALTAPKVAGVEGDGLLTMEEILALKLDADWVVLSACNTGAGTSAGAEALSGLGRAFFYAGTRALLITNWSVDSASARELVTDLFKRQAADPSLGRSEALRQAMMALVDNGVYAKGGKRLYTYAHPLFWAPYSIIGEGGGGN